MLWKTIFWTLSYAEYEEGYSHAKVVRDFTEGNKGVVSFSYNGIRETLSYTPVRGTDWLLTYLVRESVIREQIDSVSDTIIRRSLIQSILTALVLAAIFGFLFVQMRKNARLTLEKETIETENRIKHLEMEQRIALQEQLIRQQEQKEQQDKMITALASDYRSVYYVDLDKDEAVCYLSDGSFAEAPSVGDRFPYLRDFTAFGHNHVAENYREGYFRFIQPDRIREELLKQLIEMKGAEIRHAENGRIATELFAQSEPGHYDAVLMDVRMPEMDGLEATAAIRALDRLDAATVPIIALTANAFDEDVQRSLQAGMNAHLSKPVEPEHLYQTPEELIWEAEHSKENA